MTDKPQTVGDQIRAMEPQEANGRVNPREAWEAARNQAAALADAATPTGWVIANGNNNRWRCVWEWESNAEWTDDITQALKFATRDDAERYSKEDEDAWLIYQVGIPPTTTPVVGAEQAGDVGQAWRVKPLVWHNYDAWTWWAESTSGTYRVEERNGIWRATLNLPMTEHIIYEYETDGTPNDSESAHLACESDHAARITAALEPDPTPALSWRAMQTFACDVISAYDEHDQQLCCDGRECGCQGATVHQAMRHYIKADPGPTDAQLLAAALKLPEVQAMRTALQTLRNLMCEAFEDDDGNSGCGLCENDCTGCIAHFALAKIGGAA